MFVATTTVSVFRTPAGSIDPYGDPVDADIVVATGLPAHIAAVNVRHDEPGSGRTTTTEVLSIRIRWDGTLDPGTDRLLDERLGETLSIDRVDPARYFGMRARGEWTVAARRVS